MRTSKPVSAFFQAALASVLALGLMLPAQGLQAFGDEGSVSDPPPS